MKHVLKDTYTIWNPTTTDYETVTIKIVIHVNYETVRIEPLKLPKQCAWWSHPMKSRLFERVVDDITAFLHNEYMQPIDKNFIWDLISGQETIIRTVQHYADGTKKSNVPVGKPFTKSYSHIQWKGIDY